jgi:hypothetical protein
LIEEGEARRTVSGPPNPSSWNGGRLNASRRFGAKTGAGKGRDDLRQGKTEELGLRPVGFD